MGLKFIPTYELRHKHVKESPYTENTYSLVLVNTVNDFDIIEMKVSREVCMEVTKGNKYSINTRIVRTWYTLWLGKKEKHYVLGNVEDGKVLITEASLSDKAIRELQDECKNIPRK